MGHIKKFNELKSDTYRRASYKLKKLGQEDRAAALKDWSLKTAKKEEFVKWEEAVNEHKQFGSFLMKVQHPDTNESVVGDFYLSLHFDEFSFVESYREGGSGIWFHIGIVPTTWELAQKVCEIASDDDMGNGFFWAMNFGLNFNYNGGDVEYTDAYLGDYDQHLIGHVKMVDLKDVRKFRVLLGNLFDVSKGDIGYPSGYTNADTLTEVLTRNFEQAEGFSMESVGQAIRKISVNQLYASQSI